MTRERARWVLVAGGAGLALASLLALALLLSFPIGNVSRPPWVDVAGLGFTAALFFGLVRPLGRAIALLRSGGLPLLARWALWAAGLVLGLLASLGVFQAINGSVSTPERVCRGVPDHAPDTGYSLTCDDRGQPRVLSLHLPEKYRKGNPVELRWREGRLWPRGDALVLSDSAPPVPPKH